MADNTGLTVSSHPIEHDQEQPRKARSVAGNGGKPLDNPRHERFAQELAKGSSQIAAYETAGYSADRSAACKLSAKAYISLRVAHLQGLAASRIVQKAAVIDKSYVLQQAHRMFEASANAAIPAGEDEAFDHQAAGVAARFLDQIGRHRDVQAFKDASDLNLHLTIDGAISHLAHAPVDVIEGDYEDVTSDE
jgi:hypothetical protein